MMMENTYQMVAKTFQGLEDVLRDELISLGAENVEEGTRMVSFEGDLALMYKANLCCRTALRILKPIFKFDASDPDELYDVVRDIEWEKYLTPESTFAVESTVNSSEFRHSKYVAYRVKDGIVDHFNDKYGKRPSIRLKGADIILNVHIAETRVTISLDSSGEPLSYRGYRLDQTKAPINEVLAAGIIMKTGWHGEKPFADPMCGSGTFLIEAALIAANINPGIYRSSFAFESWSDFDRELFEEIYNDDSGERVPPYPIMGGDIDPEAVSIARKNIATARVGDYISLTCRSMADWKENGQEGVLVMNPPYGERLKPEKLDELYVMIGKSLKQDFKGWNAWILGYRQDLFDLIRLKPAVKYPLFNGSLECSLREFVMFEGRYDDFRAEGGSVGKEKYLDRKERDGKNKRRPERFSENKWKEEKSKFKTKDSKYSGRGPKRENDRKGPRDFKRKKGDFKPDTTRNEPRYEKPAEIKRRGWKLK